MTSKPNDTKYPTYRGGIVGTRHGTTPTSPADQWYNFEFKGKEHLVYSQGNPYFNLGKSSGRIGGNFTVIKRTLERDLMTPPLLLTSGSGLTRRWYKTPFAAFGPQAIGDYPGPLQLSNSSLDAFGAKAVAQVLPTNPLSGLLVALGELKADGLPLVPGIQTWKSRTLTAKNAGKEYLNKEFGWLPLLSDIRKFSDSVKNHDDLIRQYERNSGRIIKRGMRFPTEITSSSTEVVGGGTTHVTPYPGLVVTVYEGSNGTTRRVTTITTKREKWFKGAFTYYLPPFDPNGDNRKRNAQIRNYLYGTRVTPETLWDLTPWTWAADWVGNAGDVLHNVSAFQNDGLVMKYGYMMEHTINSKEVTLIDVGFKAYPGKKFVVSGTLTTEVKNRRTANPYGFGITDSSLSMRQIAILIALGITLV